MSRSRGSAAPRLVDAAAIVLSAAGGPGSTGATAASSWLRHRGVTPPALTRWHIELALDARDAPAAAEFDEATATRLHVDIYAEEWGLFFCHVGRASWVRVTDVPFVHGRDDWQLHGRLPVLEDVGKLVRELEAEHAIRFPRGHVLVRTNLPSAIPAVRRWVSAM